MKSSNCNELCNTIECDPHINDCDEGYYCLEGSTSSRQIQCGGSQFYCPKGSALPTLVDIGYYTISSKHIPNTSYTRSSQLICEK